MLKIFYYFMLPIIFLCAAIFSSAADGVYARHFKPEMRSEKYFDSAAYLMRDSMRLLLTDGISYRSVPDSVPKIIYIGIGGYGAELTWVEAWTDALFTAVLSRQHTGVLFSVKGPSRVYFEDREINLRILADKILSEYRSASSKQTAPKIILAAHSSGCYIAHELFKILFLDEPGNYRDLQDAIVYVLLDNDIGDKKGPALTDEMVRCLYKMYGVYAYDKTTGSYSAGKKDLDRAKNIYPQMELISVNAEISGCKKGAKWCLHDTVINLVPHNSTTYDLERDYTQFNEQHPLSTQWLEYILKQL